MLVVCNIWVNNKILKFEKDKSLYYILFQESEKELEEAEEYKEARLVLDSVKLEAWSFSVQGVFALILGFIP